MMATGPLNSKILWQLANNGKQKPSSDFYNIAKLPSFTPYAQKIIAQPGDEFYIRGDLHGDIFSLLAQLEKMIADRVMDDNFRIIPDNVWVLFLGDYVDRGLYGCEVLYTMLRLSLANPDRVIFVRGNHEDIGVSSKYGFKDEIKHKFDDASGQKHQIISRMNDFLPVVLYVGCQDTTQIINASFATNYLQCCHGGLEVGYNPQPFLDNHATMFQMLGFLNQQTFVKDFNKYCDEKLSGLVNWIARWIVKKNQFEEMKTWWNGFANGCFKDNLLLENPQGLEFDNYHNSYEKASLALGFMWNDFDVKNNRQVYYDPKRGMYYGQQATEKILELQSSETSKICGVFRAHQHGEDIMMDCLKQNNGVFKLWNPDDAAVARDSLSMENYRTLIGGKVWTFNVGADSVYGEQYGFNFDAYARLVVQEKLDDWKMQVFNTKVV